MKKYSIELKWAAIFIAMTLVWMFLEKLVGFHDVYLEQQIVVTNFYAIPAILVYVFALLEKRKKHYQNSMNYLQGFVSGLTITLIVTLFSPLTQYIISAIITPDYFNNVINYVVEHKQMTLEEAQNQFNMKKYIVESVMVALIMGVITSAIVAIFTKTKKQAIN